MNSLIEQMALEPKLYLTALLTSISCGLMGSYIVVRRLVFISGGITHASFGGIGIAYFMGLNPVIGAFVFAVLSALGIEFATKKGNVRNDSAIAFIWSLGMALGIIFIYLTPGRAPNLISYLFGSILTVSSGELSFLFLLDIVVLLIFGLFAKSLLYVSFDPGFAKSKKYPVDLVDYFMVVLIALTIVLNIRVAGIILIISMLTVPQNTVNLLTNNFKKILIGSVLLSFVSTMAGIKLSELFEIPTGATIIFVMIMVYLIVRVVKQVIG